MTNIDGPYTYSAMRAPGGITDGKIRGLHLPAVECDVCGQRTVEIGLALPSVKIPPSVQPKFLHGNREVAPQKFAEIAKEFARLNPGVARFPPGADVGPLKLQITGKCREALVGYSIEFFSQRVVDRLLAENLKLLPLPVPVLKRGKTIHGYYCLEPTILELTSQKHFEICHKLCSVCGGWSLRPEVWSKRVSEDDARVFVRDRWPERVGVVFDTLSGRTFYSDKFVSVCSAQPLEGIGFQRVGRWL